MLHLFWVLTFTVFQRKFEGICNSVRYKIIYLGQYVKSYPDFCHEFRLKKKTVYHTIFFFIICRNFISLYF